MLRLAACLAVFALPVAAEGVRSARFDDPTTRYDHGILGDAVEWGSLVIETDKGRRVRLTLPETRVFEDIAPRVVDIDGDGAAEVIAVETDLARGARLSVFGPEGLIATNDFIGSTHRWLAPVGVGAVDLDGDGRVEFAFVDRPHLAKTLIILRQQGNRLVQVAALDGVTNHRIGDSQIAGGIRDCGLGPEMVVASADWSRVLVVTFDGQGFQSREVPGFAEAMSC